MARYHINPSTGNPGLCRAQQQCPYGDDNLHYSSKGEARRAYEAEMESSITETSRQATLKILKLDDVDFSQLTKEQTRRVLTNLYGNVGERMELVAALRLIHAGRWVDGSPIKHIQVSGKRFSPSYVKGISTEELQSVEDEIRQGIFPARATERVFRKLQITGKLKAEKGSKADAIVTFEGGERLGISIKSHDGASPSIISVTRATEMEFALTNPDDPQNEWRLTSPNMSSSFQNSLSQVDPQAPRVWQKIQLQLIRSGRTYIYPNSDLSPEDRPVFQKIVQRFASDLVPTGTVSSKQRAHRVAELRKGMVQVSDLADPQQLEAFSSRIYAEKRDVLVDDQGVRASFSLRLRHPRFKSKKSREVLPQ